MPAGRGRGGVCVRMSTVNEQGFTQGSARDIGPQIEMMLKAGGHVTLQVSGDSMRPLLKPRRDAAVLETLSEWPPRKGDILFYRTPRSNSGYALHRVRRIMPNGVIMNGDAQTWVEGPIPREDVLAHAVMLLRGGAPLETETFGYRAYIRLWPLTRFIRWPMFALWRGIRHITG